MSFLNNILIKVSLLINKVGILAADIHSDEFWAPGGEGASYLFMRDFLVGLDTVLLPFMFTACTVLTLYAIVLGFNMAKAEDPKDSKKKLVGTISSLAAIVVIIMILKFIVIPNMGDIFGFITQVFG